MIACRKNDIQSHLSHAAQVMKESNSHLQVAAAMLRLIAERTNDTEIAERLNQRSDLITEQLN